MEKKKEEEEERTFLNLFELLPLSNTLDCVEKTLYQNGEILLNTCVCVRILYKGKIQLQKC